MKYLIPAILTLPLLIGSAHAQKPAPSWPAIILTPGSAPASPTNGELWTTSAGLYARINGGTVGPYGSSSGLTINSTTISGGASGRLLYDDGTKLQEIAYGLTGNSTIVETTSGGLLTASILPLATTSVRGGVIADGTTIGVTTGTIGTIVTDTTTAGSISSWSIGGQDTMSSSGTATLPTLTAGQSFTLITGAGATATLVKPGGVTLAGAVSSQSTLGPLSFLSCVYNSASVYDCASGVANPALLGTAQTFTAAQSVAEAHGTAYAPTLTSNNYNAAITDCGKTLLLPTGTTPTVTLPNVNPSTGECTIKMVQMTAGTSLYTIQAASGGTLVSANSYTHTAKQYAQIIVTLIVPSGSAATWSLAGEGS